MNLRSKLWNLIAFCTGSQINDAGPVQVAGQVQVNYAELPPNVPIVGLFGIASNPPVPFDCVVAFQDGDRSKGVVIAINHQGSRPTGQASGEVTLYNDFAMKIYLSETGIVINGGGQNITIENAPTITANVALLQVQGDIIDNYQTQVDTAAGMRTIYNSHTHDGVQSGSGTTAVPNQPMV